MTQNQTKSTNPPLKWDLAALVDLEYLSEEVEPADGHTLKKRDRDFYLSLKDDCKLSEQVPDIPSIVLLEWIAHRRQSQQFPKPGPGDTTAELLAVVKFWGFLGCVLFGALFAWGSLNISGKQVNVILFWCLTVGLPFFMTILGFYLLIGARFPRLPVPPGLRVWVGNLFIDAVSRTRWFVRLNLPQGFNGGADGIAGVIKRRMQGRREVLNIVLGSLAHLFGLGLTTGIFVSIVVFKSISYQDYGWQTHSGWLTDIKVHSLIKVVATPWSWFAGDGLGYPTTTQILETRIFHNDAANREYPVASVTWSSFLLWSSFFYGLLPRFALWGLGRIHLRRVFNSLDFGKFDAIWRRLVIENVEVEHPDADVSIPMTAPRVPQNTNLTLQGPVLFLIPAELNFKEISERSRLPLCRNDLSFSEVVPLPSLPIPRKVLVDSLSTPSKIPPARILILQESFTPPNDSFVRFLKELREAFKDNLPLLPLHVVLLHDPMALRAKLFLEAWSSQLDPIGDPLLSSVTICLEKN
jgi:Protein of unknown function (DUF2868)